MVCLLVRQDKYWKNPEYYKRKTKEWYWQKKKDDPIGLKQRAHKWYEENKDHVREWSRAYREANKPIIRLKANEYNLRNHKEAVVVLGCKCVHCGYNKDIRGLQIDKITGGHRRWAKENKTESHTLDRWIIKHPDEARRHWQILCATCNMIKRSTNNEMPNKYKKTTGVMK